ncbi:hypothetical protein OSTOST_15688, partial [Ostertagia ostertagi]
MSSDESAIPLSNGLHQQREKDQPLAGREVDKPEKAESDLRFWDFPVTDIVEVRSGYSTDNLHKAAKKYEFQEAAPEATCFSVIFSHAKFLHKSVDFAANKKQDRDRWVSALTYLISKVREQRAHFNEQTSFREADTNKNGTLSFNELWSLLKKMNLEISEKYARAMFREAEEKSTRDGVLDENEFLRFFDCLTERPELHHVLRMASSEGVEGVTVADLQKFLTEEQDVSGQIPNLPRVYPTAHDH